MLSEQLFEMPILSSDCWLSITFGFNHLWPAACPQLKKESESAACALLKC